jgi:uncharacterized membrane protein YfcA
VTRPTRNARFLPAINLSADHLGIAASALCVVHCILTPVLISLSAVAAHLLPAEENTHRAFAVLVTLLGAIALLSGFRKHGRRRILVLMAAGLALILTGACCGEHLPSHLAEVLVTLSGSALMITAHRMNHTFCRDCQKCVHVTE